MQVTAIVVTRAADIAPSIYRSFAQVERIGQVLVWSNYLRRDLKVWGRHQALDAARHSVIYSQDDDILHTPESINSILDAYEPGRLTGCMWPEWSAGAKMQGIAGGYDDLVFPGSGSVYDANLPIDAALEYQKRFPFDDFFRLWCDCIVGVLAYPKQLDIRFEVLENANAPDRMSRLPNGRVLKHQAILRARSVRDRRQT